MRSFIKDAHRTPKPIIPITNKFLVYGSCRSIFMSPVSKILHKVLNAQMALVDDANPTTLN